MNKEQFLKELESLLLDINDFDREEAIEYYRNYFEDAGIENEESIIKELGSPQKIASMIKDSLNGQFDDSIEIGNEGIKADKYEDKNEVQNVKKKTIMDKGDKFIFIILLLALFIPFTAIFGGVLGTILPILMFFFGFWILMVVFYVIGAGCIASGILSIASTLGASLIGIGIGLILIVLGNLVGKIASWFFKTVIPSICSWIKQMFNRLTNREVTA